MRYERIGTLLLIIECALPYILAITCRSWIDQHKWLILSYCLFVIFISPLLLTPMIFENKLPFKKK